MARETEREGRGIRGGKGHAPAGVEDVPETPDLGLLLDPCFSRGSATRNGHRQPASSRASLGGRRGLSPGHFRGSRLEAGWGDAWGAHTPR